MLLFPTEKNVEQINDPDDNGLLKLAMERLEHYDPATLISEEEMDRELGITEEELSSVGEIELCDS